MLRELAYAAGRELNPAHDLDRIRYTSSDKNFLMNIVNIPKHLIRGGVAGTVIGAGIAGISSMIAGADPEVVAAYTAFGAQSGMAVGGAVDALQYVNRSFLRQRKLEGY